MLVSQKCNRRNFGIIFLIQLLKSSLPKEKSSKNLKTGLYNLRAYLVSDNTVADFVSLIVITIFLTIFTLKKTVFAFEECHIA